MSQTLNTHISIYLYFYSNYKNPLVFIINYNHPKSRLMSQVMSIGKKVIESTMDKREVIFSRVGQVTVEWEIFTGWNSMMRHCTWYGVTCNRFIDIVTKFLLFRIVMLSSNGIIETLPTSIFEYAEFCNLSIPYNEFSNRIPTSVKELWFLEVVKL